MAKATMSALTKSYTTFSGVDITAVIDTVPVGDLNGISYSISREKAPVYTMGSADPRGFSRGKRGIAGSMVFAQFDRQSMHQIIHDGKHFYYRHEYEPTSIMKGLNSAPSYWQNYENIFKTDDTTTGVTSTTVDTVKATAEYLDQVMPFDITLAAQNEYGLSAWKAMIGIEILNEGGGLSVDDIINEVQCTFVCRSLTPWIPWAKGETEGFTNGEQTVGESHMRVLHNPTGANVITGEEVTNFQKITT